MPLLTAALYPFAQAELSRLLLQAWGAAQPQLSSLLSDPTGSVVRLGDALVWSGASGRQVIGGLEMISESQARIDSAVTGIESAQIAIQSTFDIVSTVSMATLGVTSLTGLLMTLRLNAINARVKALSSKIQDIEGKLDALHKAHLQTSLQYLREYDDTSGKHDKLKKCLEESRTAANIYGNLSLDETSHAGRLAVLNCRSRLYIIALLTELRCLVSLDEAKQASDRVDEVRVNLREIARCCFERTLGDDPERFLKASFQSQGVNLNTLTEIYRMAKQLEVVDGPQIHDSNDMFEFVRQQIGVSQSWNQWWKGVNVAEDIGKLKYLLACLEEAGRIEGLGLLINKVQANGESVSEHFDFLKSWRKDRERKSDAQDSSPFFAYSL